MKQMESPQDKKNQCTKPRLKTTNLCLHHRVINRARQWPTPK
jgi:hypothetical protein